MNGRQQALSTLHQEKLQKLPALQRYGKHYMEVLIGKGKEAFILNFKKQLSPLPSDLITMIELLAERTIQYKVEHQELNLVESNTAVNRCKHLYNKSFWYIHSYRLEKNSLSTFFYYLRTYVNHPPIHHQRKKGTRILAGKLAEEMVNTYFRKEVTIMPDIHEVNLFDYRVEICAWEIAHMFLKSRTQGIVSLADHFSHVKEKDALTAFWQSAITTIIAGNNLAGITMKLEFLYTDFLKDATICSDDAKLAFFIKTSLPQVFNGNISRFIDICTDILTSNSLKEIRSYFYEF